MKKHTLKELKGLIQYDLKSIFSKPAPFLMLGLVILLSILIPAYFNKIVTPSSRLTEDIGQSSFNNSQSNLNAANGFDEQQNVIAFSFDQFMDTTDPNIVNTSNYKNMEKVLLHNVVNHHEVGEYEKISGIAYFNFFSGNFTSMLILIFSAAVVLYKDTDINSVNHRLLDNTFATLSHFTSNFIAVILVLTAPILFFTIAYSVIYGVGPVDMLGFFNLRIKSGYPPDAIFSFIGYQFQVFLNGLTMHGTINMLQGSLFMLLYQIFQIGSAIAFLMVLKRFVKDKLLIIILFFGAYFLAGTLTGFDTLRRPLDYLFLTYSSSFRDTLFIPDSYNYILDLDTIKMVRDYFLGLIVMFTSTLAMLYIVLTPYKNIEKGGINNEEF
ncbi:MAG: hypothetical protein QMB63_07975 [Clostridiaceae bacterium]